MNEIIRKLSLAGNKRPVTNKDMSQIENRVFSLMFRKTSFKTPEILIKTRA